MALPVTREAYTAAVDRKDQAEVNRIYNAAMETAHPLINAALPQEARVNTEQRPPSRRAPAAPPEVLRSPESQGSWFSTD